MVMLEGIVKYFIADVNFLPNGMSISQWSFVRLSPSLCLCYQWALQYITKYSLCTNVQNED